MFVSITNNRGQAGLDGRPMCDADMARGFWRIRDFAKANACQVLVAIDKSQIVGVWNMNCTVGWQQGAPGAIPNRQFSNKDRLRYYCELTGCCREAQEVVGSSIRSVTDGKTMHGPIMYL